MRFIAKYGNYAVQVQPLVAEWYATGGSKTVQRELVARFAPGSLRPPERELAIHSWVFNGSYQMEDEVTTFPPDYRIGVFDSVQAQQAEQWTDDEREKVELELTRLATEFPSEMLAIPRTMLAPPWPNYDGFEGSQAQLMRKLVDDGHNLEEVLAYECEMQNRPEVIDALEELISTAAKIPLEEEVLG